MIELIDASSGERLGVEYTTDERAAAVAAVGMYHRQLLVGNVVQDPQVVQEGVDVCERVRDGLSDGLTATAADVDQVVQKIFFPYIAAMHEGLPARMYASVAERLGLEPFDLFYHALTARRVLDGEGVEPRLIAFGPEGRD